MNNRDGSCSTGFEKDKSSKEVEGKQASASSSSDLKKDKSGGSSKESSESIQ